MVRKVPVLEVLSLPSRRQRSTAVGRVTAVVFWQVFIGPLGGVGRLTLRVNLIRLLGRVAKWQTRTVQVRVLETGWGFNSPLAHSG